jgi:hypothetical protein
MINPQYGMPLNYFAGQTPPLSFGQNRPVRPMVRPVRPVLVL